VEDLPATLPKAGWSPRRDARPRPGDGSPTDATTLRESRSSLFIDGRSAPQVLTALVAAPGAAGLSDAESGRLKRLITGSSEAFSTPVRRELAVLLGSEAFLGATPEGQTAQLKAFLTEEVGVPDLVSVADPTRISRRQYTVSEPVAEPKFAFEGHPADGKRFQVTIGDKQVTVHAADAIDASLEQNSVEQVARGLAALPESSLAGVKEVRLEPAPNPNDAHFAAVYNRPNFHSYMTAGADGIIRIFPDKGEPRQTSLDGTLIHETGHILSHRLLGEDASGPGWAAWRDAEAKDGLHASQYARVSPDEDLSETLELYTLVNGGPSEAAVRALLPARFEQLDQLLARKLNP
jgi:hypothetical protein